MNLTIARALLEDARQQVLDNKIFRLLVILTGIPILFTFVVGFHPEEIRLFWGWKTIQYESLKGFGGSIASLPYPDEAFIHTIQGLVVNFFGGSLGIMFCIAATAFFTPRILEKGAADTLFSKPVSRLVILLSRYFAGILFIAILAAVLVFGMFLGLWVTSGYRDPGFLWGVLTLIYLFSLIHAFSICIAALTRSSTAAILLSLILFMFSGAIHQGWAFKEYATQQQAALDLRSAEDPEAEAAEGADDEQSAIMKVLVTTLDTLHYALPKTSDADMITNKLRRALTEVPPQLETADGEFLVKRAPESFSLVEESLEDLEGGGVRWIADSDSEITGGVVSLRRYPRPEIVDSRRNRTRRQTARSLAKEFEEELAASESLEEEPGAENEKLSGVYAVRVHWVEAGRMRERLFFHYGDWIYEIDFDLDLPAEDTDAMGRARWRDRFLHGRVNNLVLGQVAGLMPDEWYDKVFGWTSPWKYNIFFSIGTSLAFALSMLLLAWLKLRRIDF